MAYITIPVKTWYLKKDKKISLQNKYTLDGLIKPWKPVNTDEYLQVYRSIGNEWGWTGRTLMSDEDLQSWLNSSNCQLYILKKEGNIAGFIEFDFSQKKQPEIVYFGLLPNYIGQKLGLPFLINSVHLIEQNKSIDYVWLHTCEYDHPSAIKVYQKAGFEVWKESTDEEPYDEDFLKYFKEKYQK